jgi:maleylpyruvate isomerase
MRTLATSLAWMADGTTLCAKAIADADLDHPSLLPGWTRKHVVAHLAANAEALGNLVHWARTGEERRMYTSPEQRNADIESGAGRSANELRTWFAESAQVLADAIAELTEEQWQPQVLTAQGRQVPATEIPWMRSREVMIHSVDLGAGITFADLSDDFLEALCADIRAKRGSVPDVQGPLAEVAAYLAGRSYEGVLSPDGSAAPPLPPWL